MDAQTNAQAGSAGRVLVVESNARGRDRVGGWLELAGYEVLGCPGPTAPSYECVGSLTGRCSLLEAADAVVLDLHLASDTIAEGTPGWELLLLYAGWGKPVVALMDEDDPVVPIADDRVAVVRRPATREAVLDALRSLIGASQVSPSRQEPSPSERPDPGSP